MNRFRLWDIQRKVMIYSDNNNYGVEIYLDGSFSVEFYRDGHWWCEDSENYILMRSTGFSDKNGKEIYEGDIAKCPYPKDLVCTVEYFRGQFILRSRGSMWIGEYPVNTLEIIGNIYENSDLFK